MFGFRSDGKRVKHLPGLYNIMPMIMPKRNDALNWNTFDIDLEPWNQFINEQKELTGRVYSYTEILTAAIIRVMCLRPGLNRFIFNRKIYQHNDISFSIVAQKSLKRGKESDETSIKMHFTGKESLAQIADVMEAEFKKVKHAGMKNATDKLTDAICSAAPIFTIPLVSFIKFLDKIGVLPKSVLEASPFHTSFFITDMRSIKLPPLWHHIYNFGTTGMFFSTGSDKEVLSLNKETGEVTSKIVMPVNFVSDERYCDGYYFANSFRMMLKILKNPKLLLEPLADEDVPLDHNALWKKNKLEAKAQKKQAKKNAKLAKKAKPEVEE